MQESDFDDGRYGTVLLERLFRLSVWGPVLRVDAGRVQRHNGITENECAYA